LELAKTGKPISCGPTAAASLVIGGLLVLDALNIIRATRRLIAGESIALPFRLDIEKASSALYRALTKWQTWRRFDTRNPAAHSEFRNSNRTSAVDRVSSVPTFFDYFETVKIVKECVPSQEHGVHSYKGERPALCTVMYISMRGDKI
jgi:hypothetical protein